MNSHRTGRVYAATFCALLLSLTPPLHAEDQLDFGGNVKYLQTLLLPDTSSDWLLSAEPRNRFEITWFAAAILTIELGVQNRFTVGEFVEEIPRYAQLIDDTQRLFDLSWIIAEGRSYVWTVAIDRGFADLEIDPLRFRIGRFRANWGLNLVWNPNDLFNAESFFDFGAEVSPGMDGAELTVYLGPTSFAQIVAEGGPDIDSTSMAGRYRFNTGGYDFQFFGGMVTTDIVIGGGWSGSIGGAAFRGEISYFHPRLDFARQWGQIVAAVSSDYTFTSGLFLQGAMLVNSTGTTGKAGRSEAIVRQELSVKELTPALGSLFSGLRYPFTPLLNGELALIVNPFDGSGGVFPGVAYSLTQTVELLGAAQLFFGRRGTEFGDVGYIWYAWLLWSF